MACLGQAEKILGEMAKLKAASPELVSWTQLEKLQSSTSELDKFDYGELDAANMSPGSFTDPGETAFQLKALMSYRGLEMKMKKKEVEFADDLKKKLDRPKVEIPEVVKLAKMLKPQIALAVAACIAAVASSLKVEQIAVAALALMSLAALSQLQLQGELADSLCQMRKSLEVIEFDAAELKFLLKKMEMEFGWLYSSVRKLEFSNNARDGNVIRSQLALFDKMSYIEVRLMWLVSGASDTVRQIGQQMQEVSKMEQLVTSLTQSLKLWAAARLRFRDLQQAYLGAAWKKFVVEAADNEIARQESWKKELEKGDSVQVKELKEANQKMKMLAEIKLRSWDDIEFDL